MKESLPEDFDMAFNVPVCFCQMRAVISGVMRKLKLRVEQLTAVDLATFGHLICGLSPSEIKRLSPYNLRSAKYLPQVHQHGTIAVKVRREGSHSAI